jgi:hypothetical protein
VVARLRRSFSDRRIAMAASLGLLSTFVIGMIALQIAYSSAR